MCRGAVASELIREMNAVNTRRTLTQHRKVAIAFRDNALLPIFETSLNTLKQCASNQLGVAGGPFFFSIPPLFFDGVDH